MNTAPMSDDHRVLVQGVHDYACGELLELDHEWDKHERSCCERLSQLYEMGLMALRVPESNGGLECPMVPYAHIIRELAYASPLSPSPSASTTWFVKPSRCSPTPSCVAAC